MLGKLLKHEFIATGRVFLPTYAALLAVALLNNVLGFANETGPQSGIIPTIMVIAYGVLIGSVFVMSIVISIRRFRASLLGDEGYLTHTLPVRLSAIVNSKLIVAIVWNIASTIVAILSVFLLLVNSEILLNLFQNFGQAIQEIIQLSNQYGLNFALIFAEACALTLLSTAMMILLFYCAMAIGHLAQKRKVLASVGSGIVLFIAVQYFMEAMGSIIERMGGFNGLQRGLEGLRVSPEMLITMPLINMSMLYAAIMIVAVCAALYAGTLWILGNKLNLE